MSTPPVHRTFAEQHAFNCQAVAQLWADPRYADAPEVIETDRDGNPIMSPPPDLDHDLRKNRIAKTLERLMAEGEAFVETAVSTFQGAKVPDASWFGHERLQERLNAPPEETLPRVAPEVCVEVLSPGNTETQIEGKKSAYFEVGVREVWVCDGEGNITFDGPQGPLERSVICPEFPRHVPAQLERSITDTVSTVMRDRRKKACPKPSSAAALAHNLAASPSGVVNNAGSCQKSTGSFAFGPARSSITDSRRVLGRSPAGSEASSPKVSREPHPQRILYQFDSGLKLRQPLRQYPPQTPHRKATMSPGSPLTYFAGFDWAKRSHHVLLVNAAGQIETEFRFEHSEAGWQQWRRQATQFAPLAVAVSDQSRHRHRPTASDA